MLVCKGCLNCSNAMTITAATEDVRHAPLAAIAPMTKVTSAATYVVSPMTVCMRTVTM